MHATGEKTLFQACLNITLVSFIASPQMIEGLVLSFCDFIQKPDLANDDRATFILIMMKEKEDDEKKSICAHIFYFTKN